MAKRYGCSVGTVQSIRSQVDARLALEREQAAAHQEALAAAAAPHEHVWVCRICGEAAA
jgi:rubrerythrin